MPLWKHQEIGIAQAKDKKNFAFFFDPGCISGDMEIRYNRRGCSRKITLRELYFKFSKGKIANTTKKTKMGVWNCDFKTRIRSFKEDVIGLHAVQNIVFSGIKKTSLLKLENGFFLKATRDHLILTVEGFKRLDTLTSYDYVMVDTLSKHKKISLKNKRQKHKDPSRCVGKFHPYARIHYAHNKTSTTYVNGYFNFKHGIPEFSKVSEISLDVLSEETYDIACEEPYHNFVANGIIVHNCGKTRTVIELLKYHYEQAECLLPTLILCPVIVVENWKHEFKLYSNVPSKYILTLRGDTKTRIKTLEGAASRNVICITNYEGLVSSEGFFKKLFEWKPYILVCDESHKCKSFNSKRTKLTTKLADYAEYKYLLSGTPILNSPLDIFSQYLIMDGGITFGRNFYVFRNKYFYDKNFNMPKQKHFPNYVLRANAIEEMNELIYTKAMQAKKEECLDLPPLIKKVIHVELGPQQRQMYDEMKQHFITFLQDQAVTADMALVKGLRLLQIVTGFVKTEESKVISFDTPRKSALKELLEEITPGHKVIVWCVFKENYHQVGQVCEDLKIGFVEAHGGVTDKQKLDAVEAFNTDPTVRVFIGHPGSLGIGINLIAASYSIYYSRSFSLEHDIQSEARNYRGGSEIHKSICRIDIVAKNTIDEMVCQALNNKASLKDELLKWGRTCE